MREGGRRAGLRGSGKEGGSKVLKEEVQVEKGVRKE